VIIGAMAPSGAGCTAGLCTDDRVVAVNGVACENETRAAVVRLFQSAVAKARLAAQRDKAQRRRSPTVVLPGEAPAFPERNSTHRATGVDGIGGVDAAARGGDYTLDDAADDQLQRQREGARLMDKGEFRSARTLLEKAIATLDSSPERKSKKKKKNRKTSPRASGGVEAATVEGAKGDIGVTRMSRATNGMKSGFVPLRPGAAVTPRKAIPQRHSTSVVRDK
jgi:hypothetical protein